ncbi:thymidylate synthase [Billgrantia azerbaijanica]|nr:thymidylate synthase [Halomonas azerbaijanica]
MLIYSGRQVGVLYYKALLDSYSLDDAIYSRVGDVYDLGPACFEITSNGMNIPMLIGRGLNPFFMFAEAAWVLEGRNDLSSLEYYIKSYSIYSDDNISLNGAYGYRIRSYFGFDQIEAVVSELKRTPRSRRALITLYSPSDIINYRSKDLPCNVSMAFKIRREALDITVFNRSNDIFMGVPYNFFVFRCIQFYIASLLGVPVGVQRHITDSLHLYKKNKDSVYEILTKNNQVEAEGHCFSDSSKNVMNNLVNSYVYINRREFDKMEDGGLKCLFKAYEKFKSGDETFLLSISERDDILGELVSDWINVWHPNLKAG